MSVNRSSCNEGSACWGVWRAARAVALVATLAALSACASGPDLGLGYGNDIDRNRRSGEPTDLELAQANFRRGAFGLSEKHFRLAIENNRKNAEAWLGLAASYDQLRRFDLADRAYDKAQDLLGEDPVLLNNRGYSQILRGNYANAEVLLARAQQKAPDDERIVRNIEFLYQRRAQASQAG